VTTTVLALQAFVPAKDLELSTRFYVDLGFKVIFANAQIAQLEIDSFRFLLQPFYVKAHAENFMMQLRVADADAWWAHVQRIGLTKKYPGITARAPAMQPWGLRVMYLSDPTGVLWHLAEQPRR